MYEKVCYKYLKYLKMKGGLGKEAFTMVLQVYGNGGKRAEKIWNMYLDWTDDKLDVLK
jgi:hypothetical protein